MEDFEIIKRVKAGETDAFSLLVEKYHRMLLSFIQGLMADPAIVEDIGQDVFLSAYKSIESFDDIIIHVFPDDRSKVFIRRIEALPGDRVTLEDGSRITVPHGSIYVMGDNRENSMDSRAFGSVPLSDVLGKARQVLVSRGGKGLRWDRIGRTL